MNSETFDELEKRLTAERAWSKAEKRLINEVGLGEFIIIGDAVPEKQDDDPESGNSIRADLIRWFALGGEEGRRPHEKGLRLWGGWITGALDVQACTLPAPLLLAFCRFDAALIFRDAKTKTLNFQGSHLRPDPEADVCFAGDRLQTEGGVFLRSVQANGEVRLLGAEIGGNLECDAGRFENQRGKALNADGAKVAGSVILRNLFRANGEVRLNRAEIDGTLACDAGRFENAGGKALNADGAKVAGTLFLRNPPSGEAGPAAMFTGDLDLTNAEVGRLVDAEDCWPKEQGQLRIDQFRYGRIAGSDNKGKAVPTDARRRDKWLHLQRKVDLGEDFRSQPWEHLEKVLREQGDDLEARRLGVLREKARIKARKHLFTATGATKARRFWQKALFLIPNFIIWLAYIFYGWLVGYGYFTSRALLYAVPLWLFGALLFAAAWDEGAMAPPNPLVLANESWTSCEKTMPEAPNKCWVSVGKPGAKTYAFNSLLYSFDVFLPVLTIEQEGVWEPVRGAGAQLEDTWPARRLPAEARAVLGTGWGTIGDVAYFFRFFHELMGYVLSAFLLAGGARLVREQK